MGLSVPQTMLGFFLVSTGFTYEELMHLGMCKIRDNLNLNWNYEKMNLTNVNSYEIIK